MSDFITDVGANFKLNWLQEFLPKKESFIAGGCFKDIFTNVRIKDLDIFSHSLDAANEYINYLKSKPSEYNSIYATDKVVVFKHSSGIVLEVNRFLFGEPEEVISRFDFTISKFAYYLGMTKKEEFEFEEYKVVYQADYFKDLSLRRTVIDNDIPYPLSTFDRMFKYAKKGFYPCFGTKQKVAKAIHALVDIADIETSIYSEGID